MTHEARRKTPQPDTLGYYDAFAETGLYDDDSEKGGWTEAVEMLIAEVPEFHQSSTIKSVLDLGAGTGLSVAAVKKIVQPKRVVAVDGSAKMLGRLRSKYPETEVQAVTSTIENYVAHCDERFDLVTLMSVGELLPQLPEVLTATAKLLNRDGTLAFTYIPQVEDEPHEILIDDSAKIGHSVLEYRWQPEAIKRALREGGLTIVSQLDSVIAQKDGAESQAADRIYDFVVARKLH